MKNHPPKISVIMPIFNAEKYLKEAISSVLKQTFKDFELIIVNDASIDKTGQIIKSFKDRRIKVFKNKKNLGVTKSLNIGLKNAKGEFIARADADDINLPQRFEKQLKFLEKNPDYVLVGSNFQLINEKGNPVSRKSTLQFTDDQIKKELMKRNPIAHPSVMIKKSSIDKTGGYRNIFNGAEDYDLWFRLSSKGKFQNLREKLIKRRITREAVTQRKHLNVEIRALAVRIVNFASNNLDILVGLLTFLTYKFYLTNLLFKDRMLPPEPDDVYLYLLAAKNLFNIENFEQFRMLLFSIWLNLISFIGRIDFEQAFKANFYLGYLILFPILIYFLRQIEKNVLNRIILITMFGLYTGSGAYHGFYWVLPSFYLIAVIFMLLGVIFSERKVSKLFMLLTTAIFIVVHPSSVLFLLTFLFIPIIYFCLKIKDRQKTKVKSIAILFIGIFVYVIYGLVAKNFPSLGSMNSPSDTISSIFAILRGEVYLVSMPIIWHEYFRFIFLNPVTIFAFALCIGFCFYLKQFKLLTIFVSSLALVMISSINPFGYRSLGLLWPVTFLILGYGLIGLKTVIGKRNELAGIVVSIGFLIVFAFGVNLLNFVWIKSQSVKDNYSWNKNCPRELNSTETQVIFDSWEGYNAFLLNGFAHSHSGVINPGQSINHGDLFVAKDRSQLSRYNPEGLEKVLISNITRAEKFPEYKVPDYYWTNIGSDQINNFNKVEIKDCGFFKIFKLEKYLTLEKLKLI